ncbi:MAG TPA: hypothetical protein VJ835_09430 [Fimbriimonadaceae bacterium]|nr:hypothetical protein [Fimbriimonadaceae bacterium]
MQCVVHHVDELFAANLQLVGGFLRIGFDGGFFRQIFTGAVDRVLHVLQRFLDVDAGGVGGFGNFQRFLDGIESGVHLVNAAANPLEGGGFIGQLWRRSIAGCHAFGTTSHQKDSQG